LFISLPAFATDPVCPSIASWVREIGLSLEDVEIERAAGQARDAADSMTCQTEVVSPMAMAALMQLSGAVHHFNDQKDKAVEAFSWAISASPGTSLDAAYGEDAAALFSRAREKVLGEQPGSMMVIGDVTAWIDGQSIAANTPLSVSVGAHLLQWREAEGDGVSSRVILVDPSEERRINLGGIPADASIPFVAASAEPASGFKINIVMMGGGGLLLASGGSWLMATSAKRAFESETDPNKLVGHGDRANMFGTISAVTAVAGVGAIAAGLFLEAESPLVLGVTPMGFEAKLVW